MSRPAPQSVKPLRTDGQSLSKNFEDSAEVKNAIMKQYSEARADCINDENIGEDDAKKFEETQKVTPETHCYAGCLGYKMGVIKEEGGFDAEAWNGLVSQIDDVKKRERLLRVGNISFHALHGLDRCESGNELAGISHVFKELKDYE
ncbi:hypothetical protein N7490_007963 [Penicillium lividum]|nr:hypothetical protein N7490_007963 [Penicillium lividum]